MTTAETPGVLVVEDDADTRANLVDLLELDGYRVETAATAAETFSPRDWSAVSVVILDRKLPDGTADEILPRLGEIAPHAQVIVATGYADVTGAITAVRQGAADYLLKPVQPDILRAALARITQRVQLERDKQRSEKAFRTLVETSPSMIVILRFDLRIAYFSPFAEELTGWPGTTLLGEDFRAALLPLSEDAETKEPLQRLLSGRPVRDCESRIRCRDGSHRWIMWNANRLDDYEGEPALLLIALDITERKRAEEQVLQAQRLAAIGEAMTGLIHESRNALQRSQACLEMLAEEVQDRPDALGLVGRTQRAQVELQHLYEEVRQYAAPVRLSRESTDLCGLWRSVWHDLAPQHNGRSLHLAEQLDAGDTHCNVDRFAVGQVWRNILENAVHCSPQEGKITVTCRETDLEGQAALRVAFRDAGPGMNLEQRQRIFEPFFTTKTKGTGLGMAIAQRIVHAHGGRISVGEPDGPGAEIVVILPREST